MHTSVHFLPKDLQKYPSGTRPELGNLAYGRLATPTRIRSTRHRLTTNAMGLGLTTARCLSAEDQLLGEIKGRREERAAFCILLSLERRMKYQSNIHLWWSALGLITQGKLK